MGKIENWDKTMGQNQNKKSELVGQNWDLDKIEK